MDSESSAFDPPSLASDAKGPDNTLPPPAPAQTDGAPTLPPPTQGTTSLAPPTLAPPSADAPSLNGPPAAFAAPTSPPASPASQSFPAPIAQEPQPAPAEPPSVPTSERPRGRAPIIPAQTASEASAAKRQPASRSKARTALLAILAVLAVAAAVWFGFRAFSSDDSANNDNPADATNPTAEADSGSPILDPINDADDVVDQINDNEGEIELLEELGLDPNGRPIPAGYQFTTVDRDGFSLTVQVDTTTGDFSVESTDGFAFRSIDGIAVARGSSGDPWTPLDSSEMGTIQPFGLDRLVVASDIIPPSIEPWITETGNESADGVTTTTYALDVASLNAEQPQLLAQWVTPFGLDPTDLVDATSGAVMITMSVDQDGVLQAFTIDTPDVPNAISYRVDEIYDDAPDISL